MKKQHSYVRLSTEEYSALVMLESDKVKRLEEHVEHLKKTVESDFTVQRAFFETMYLKKAAGMEYVFEFLNRDFERLKKIEEMKTAHWKLRFWLVFLAFVSVSAVHVYGLLK